MTGGPNLLREPGPGRARVRRGSARDTRPDDRLELASLLPCALLAVLAVPVALAVATIGGHWSLGAGPAAAGGAQPGGRRPARGCHHGHRLLDRPGDRPGCRDRTRRQRPEGTVTVPVGASAGETVRIWTDADGRRTGTPLTPGTVGLTSVVSGAVTVLVAVAGTAGLRAGVCTPLDRSRARRWAREWDEVEPVWAARFRLR
jgi:hypothetical protein